LAELIGNKPLEWWLEKNSQSLKFLGPKKNLSLVPIPHVRLVGRPGTEKIGSCKNALLDMSRVLNSKCPKHSAQYVCVFLASSSKVGSCEA
jgi:hypothetical protein